MGQIVRHIKHSPTFDKSILNKMSNKHNKKIKLNNPSYSCNSLLPVVFIYIYINYVANSTRWSGNNHWSWTIFKLNLEFMFLIIHDEITNSTSTNRHQKLYYLQLFQHEQTFVLII